MSWSFALVVMGTYGLLTLPILMRQGFDPSVFIVAGDKFVDATRLVSPIIVRSRADGYDGQFFYRLALAPFNQFQAAFGIRFDSPPQRMQRIVYPVLAWGLAFGQRAAVPAAMVLVNLLGLGAIAMIALRLTARLHLPAITPIAVMLWPGFIVALTHDTAEIIAAALLLGAIERYLAGRLIAYGVLGALASLTRETSVLALGGVLCFEMVRAVPSPRPWQRRLICGLSLAPFLVWQRGMSLVWGQSPLEGAGYRDMDWPFMGVVTMIRDTLTGTRIFVPVHGADIAIRIFELGSALWLLGFCAVAVVRATAMLRADRFTGALAAGWLPICALMFVLAADGPWINAIGYLRAFTECFVLGCLIVALRPVPRWLGVALFAGGVVAWVEAWGLSVIAVGYSG